MENRISFSITLNPLPSLVESNKAAYLLSGFCDTSQNNKVRLRVWNKPTSTSNLIFDQLVDCTNNRFSELLDLSDIITEQFIVRANRFSLTDIVEVDNEILVPVDLSSLPQINDGNRMAYPISGDCGSSESIVTVTFGPEEGVGF